LAKNPDDVFPFREETRIALKGPETAQNCRKGADKGKARSKIA